MPEDDLLTSWRQPGSIMTYFMIQTPYDLVQRRLACPVRVPSAFLVIRDTAHTSRKRPAERVVGAEQPFCRILGPSGCDVSPFFLVWQERDKVLVCQEVTKGVDLELIKGSGVINPDE